MSRSPAGARRPAAAAPVLAAQSDSLARPSIAVGHRHESLRRRCRRAPAARFRPRSPSRSSSTAVLSDLESSPSLLRRWKAGHLTSRASIAPFNSLPSSRPRTAARPPPLRSSSARARCTASSAGSKKTSATPAIGQVGPHVARRLPWPRQRAARARARPCGAVLLGLVEAAANEVGRPPRRLLLVGGQRVGEVGAVEAPEDVELAAVEELHAGAAIRITRL